MAAKTLDALLVRWRATRSPVVADAIDAMSRADLGLAKVRTVDDARRLVRKLEDDPRLAHFVHGQLAGMVYTASSSRPIWEAYFAILEAVRDPRTVAVVANVRAAWRAKLARRGAYARWFEAALDAAEAAARAVAVVRVPATEVAFAFATRPVTRTDAHVRALFEAVHADPTDDAARSVLADALLEREDPRGELIRLQLQSARSREDDARVKALLAEHGRAWLGDLAPFVSVNGLVYERGFPAQLTIVKPRGRSPAYPIGAPQAATVETLDVGGSLTHSNGRAWRDGAREWILSFPHLRRLEIRAYADVIGALVATGPVPYESFKVRSTAGDVKKQHWFTRKNFPNLTKVENDKNRSFRPW